MNKNHVFLTGLIVLEILVLFLGCTGDSATPVVPSPLSQQDISAPDFDGSGTSGRSAAVSPPALWGLYRVSYDSSTGMIESIPLRGAAFAVNVVQFLQPPAGSQYNLGIDINDDSDFLTSGELDIRVHLHHPFPGQDQYTGFDVAGIFITEGSLSAPQNKNLTYADPLSDPTLLNADGHTRWMNPTEFLTGNIFGYEDGFWGTSESSENSGFIAGATLNPFKYFAHHLSPDVEITDWLEDPYSVSNRGMFPSGATCSRDYELLFPIVQGAPVFVFNYAVLANWAEPINDPVENPLKDFPSDANAGPLVGGNSSAGDWRFDLRLAGIRIRAGSRRANARA